MNDIFIAMVISIFTVALMVGVPGTIGFLVSVFFLRNKKIHPNIKQIYLTVGIIVLMVVLVGIFFYITRGMPGFFDTREYSVDPVYGDTWGNKGDYLCPAFRHGPTRCDAGHYFSSLVGFIPLYGIIINGYLISRLPFGLGILCALIFWSLLSAGIIGCKHFFRWISNTISVISKSFHDSKANKN